MYRILLVDDEEIERLALKKTITESVIGTKVELKEANNGRIALMKLAEFRPNIVFLDIKMPGIDGIEAAEEMKKMDKSVKIIIVTAYESFKYAKQAVKLGVDDYLLKPTAKEEIIEVLTKVVGEIELERRKRDDRIELRDNYRRALSIIQSREITSLIVGNEGVIGWSGDGEDWLPIYEIPSYVMVLEFGNGQTENNQRHNIRNFIENQLIMILTKSFVGEIHMNQLPILVQISEEEKDQESMMSLAIKNGKVLIEKMQRHFPHIDLRIGIGTGYSNIEDFVQSYHEALFALAKTTRPFTCTYYNHLLSEGESVDCLYDLEKKLLENIMIGKTDESILAFKQYFEKLIVSSNRSLEKIKEKMNELFILLNRQVYEKKIEVAFHQEYMKASSIYQLQELVSDQIRSTTKSFQSVYFSDSKDLISFAKEYIQQHYEKSITLEDVAEVVQFSPHYFSKLFKERCGIAFIDYLTKIRVEKAKELMQAREKSLKEICYQVGYRDPNYFSRVFKRTTGLSPTEYRSKQFQ